MPVTDLLGTIGSTPLVELKNMSPKPGIRLFAKLEGQNPSGSIKDRVALAMVEELERARGLKPGDTLIEASTGNTAIALAMVARQKGYHLKVVLPEGVVPSIADVLNLYGVEMIWCQPCAGMLGPIQETHRLARENGWFAVGQFSNPVNVATHYRTTGEEIARALPEVDVFVAGMGTGGTIMGVGRRLREVNGALKLIGVEPRIGERLQGLRNLEDGFHPPLIDLDQLNGRFLVPADKAIAMAHRIIQAEGIMAGVSCGATMYAALRVAERMDRGNIVVMFSDGGWKYLPAKPWEAGLSGDVRLEETHWW